ncbi:MAG: hypothetical protein A3D67_00175 [Candidatus Lloydbacteria bacterium RIFCSPHIGHO2_02_FULL_51_22]|uniref:Uncharacterized protein n=2 Tax=Candidatus Lloydiibacteriota TaxID=1817910 RepID=A0A1G2DD44_9BACT|nr:MAG: hypothetical protein A3D67_00175 [Candidatus Lloydbacteria bacterium RIFCSPHIGHO2_02_FULL_51_22]OGZ15486.1 MAG: hypothetical protein A3J08_02310 [Candidatus Lloydbacteria bacterium RIFCSPLOWO2_02_FULL_51_11]
MLATVNPIIGKINAVILNPLITLLFALALVMFLWGMFQFLWMEDSDKAHEQGKNHMLWGLLGMFIMFSVFAIMRLIAGTIGADLPAGLIP